MGVEESRLTSEKDKLKGQANSFRCKDFIVVDNNARISLLKASQFEEIDRELKKGAIILESIVSEIVCSAVRPYSNTITISCANSILY